ncbi:MAG TPA: hypothetical protein VFM87_09300, partial [Agrococcus sp.]|nr:hypothetical protein [Agrococcus sp.]
MARNDSRPQGARRPNDRDSSSRPGSRSKGHRGFRDEQPSKGRWNRDDRDRREGAQQGGSRRPNWTPPGERTHDSRRGPAFRTRGGADGGRDHQKDDRLHRGERPRGFDRARDEHNGRGSYGAAPQRGERRFDDRGPRRDDRGFGDRREQGERRFDDRGPRRDDRGFGDRREQGERRFDDRG